MKIINADDFDALLVDAQRRAKNNFQYGFLSSVRENLAMMPEAKAYKEARERIENMAGIIEDQKERIDIMAADMPIHCKDCKYRSKQPEPDEEGALEFPVEYACPCECDDGYYSWYPDDNWFCANGKRKEGEQHE